METRVWLDAGLGFFYGRLFGALGGEFFVGGNKRWETPLVCWAGVAGLERLPVLRTGALVRRSRRAHPELAR